MAQVAKRRWETNLVSGLPRRDRQGCDYEAYIPDPLTQRTFALEGNVAADVADAEAAITRMNARAHILIDTEALARLLLRAESVASSKIEGLEVGPRRLMRAELARSLDGSSSDVTAVEVLNNIHALAWAVETLAAEPSITPRGLLQIHLRLMKGRNLPSMPVRLDPDRTGSAEAATTRVPLPSSLPHPNWWTRCLRTSATSATRPRCLQSPRRRSPMRSSRPSIHSSMGTAEPDER